jgi:hypothetical protein
MQRPNVIIHTMYGKEEYLVHSVFPKLQIFQFWGPPNVRTWQETHKIFKEKVGFFGLVKLSLHIAYLKKWDFK